MRGVAPYNKQLQRTAQTASRRGARAPFHYARAPRFIRERAAAELRRYAARGGYCGPVRAAHLAVIPLAVPLAATAGVFGEGYSSAAPGAPSEIHFRAFTIYTGEEACRKSPVPTELRVLPNPIQMSVGDRIHRSNVEEHSSELAIEAYDKDGRFLPAVPIVVSTLEVQNVLRSRSDWDYFEALRKGEDELVVVWACTHPDGVPVQTRVRILVTRKNADAVD